MSRKKTTPTADRHGALLPMLAVVMLLLMVVVSLGVDIARMHLTRSELRTANDAAARAAVVEIGKTQNVILAEDAAIAVAERNFVAGKGLALQRSQIQVGHATQNGDTGVFEFSAGGPILTSARVTGARDENSKDGPVSLLFGPMFGVDTFSTGSSAAATQTHRDIALVLDVSGSMAKDGKFEALQDALAAFLDVLAATPQSEHISVVAYDSTSRQIQELTPDFTQIIEAFGAEVPSGRTAIGLGLRDGLDSVLNDANARSYALKSIVVMTDGKHNKGIDPELVALEAENARVSIYSVTFSAGAEKERMKKVAQNGKGKHVHADSASALKEAFEDIAEQLSVVLIE